MIRLVTLALTVSVCLRAQEPMIQFNFGELKKKAAETVEVNLDGALLNMAIKFLSDSDPDEKQVKKLIGDVRGIYVRSLTFDKDGQYSASELDQIRAQLKGPQWARVVEAVSNKARGSNTGVYFKTDGNRIQGIVVLSAEARELTVVNIVGSIDPAEVRKLSGKFGIPNLDGGAAKNPKAKKNDEEE